MTGRSYKQQPPDDAWDVIVIGSGIGGLATAALLSRFAGKRVLVLERHYTAGGFTHTFKRPGLEWDVGLHYVGQLDDPGSGIPKLWDTITGGALKWARMPEVYDRVYLGERSYDFVAGKQNFVDELVRSFPDARASIDAYLELVRRGARDGLPYFVDKTLPSGLSRVVGPLLRASMFRWSDRTVADVVRPVVRDARLFDVLTAQFGDYGLTPREASFAVHAMVVGHYLRGAYYPIGGSKEIAATIEPVIASSGGAIATSAEVAEIVLERGRATGVRMADGRVLRAPIVVSTAGLPATWLSLVPRDAAERTGWPARLAGVPRSIAHQCLYIGARGTDAELGLDGTNLWLYPEGDRDEAFARAERDPSAPFPLVYASFPSSKDPTFAARHPGRVTIELITPAWRSWVARWEGTRWHKRGPEYDALKARMTERLLDVLYAHRPKLRGRIDHAELSTPLSTAHFTGYTDGEMYGLAHTPARFRLPARAQTEIPGLYVAGQDLISCGVTGALVSGAMCALAVMRGDVRSLLRRRAPTHAAPHARAARPRDATAPQRAV